MQTTLHLPCRNGLGKAGLTLSAQESEVCKIRACTSSHKCQDAFVPVVMWLGCRSSPGDLHGNALDAPEKGPGSHKCQSKI